MDESARRAAERASPLAAKMAQQAGIDLGVIDGSGVGGRVMAADVLRHLAPSLGTGPSENAASATEATVGGRSRAGRVATSARCPADELLSLQRVLNDALGTQAAVSLDAILMKVAAAALARVPALGDTPRAPRSSPDGSLNIGIVVTRERGPSMAAVGDAERLGVAELARTVAALRDGAESGGLLGVPPPLTLSPPSARVARGELLAAFPEIGALLTVSMPDTAAAGSSEAVLQCTLDVDEHAMSASHATRFLEEFVRFSENPRRLVL